MNTIELQNSIIRKILNTNDNQLLDYLNSISNERISGITNFNLLIII